MCREELRIIYLGKLKDLSMPEIQFVHLYEIEQQQIINLMNNELVGKHLPLLQVKFSTEHCEAFLNAKKQLWDENGYGPWAFIINEKFAGWGGLQPERGEADFALVLHPDFWGWGRKIFSKIKEQAFEHKNMNSITILFPPDRTNWKAITRLGFIKDSEVIIDGATFMRFRLTNSLVS